MRAAAPKAVGTRTAAIGPAATKRLVAAAAATALGASLAAVVPASARADGTASVNVLFQSFSPSRVDLLPGETVAWTNQSERLHTLTANDGSFDSGELAGGRTFSHRFAGAGSYAYHCRLHPGMVGSVDVRRVILDPLPPGAVPAGKPIRFSGRTADAGPVTLQRRAAGRFRAVARALPGAAGRWSVNVTPRATATYRAVIAASTSQTRRLLVTNRSVRVRARRGRIHVTVAPAYPGARVRLQLKLRERFGWWPAASRRLDYLSRATFVVRRRARARVVLVDRDGWTPAATSRVVRVAPRKRSRARGAQPQSAGRPAHG